MHAHAHAHAHTQDSGKHRQQSDTGHIEEQKQTLHTYTEYKDRNKEAGGPRVDSVF